MIVQEEGLLLLKESTIRLVYEFLKILLKKNLVPNIVPAFIIDPSEIKFCKYIFEIGFIKSQFGFAKLTLLIIATPICFLEIYLLADAW